MRKDIKKFAEEMQPSLDEEQKKVVDHLEGFFDLDSGILDYVLMTLVRRRFVRVSSMLFAAAFAAWEAEKEEPE